MLAFVVVGTLLFGFAALSCFKRGEAPVGTGWTYRAAAGAIYVDDVDPRGPATALRTGDRLISVNGNALAASYGPKLSIDRLGTVPGYRLEVERNGSRLSLQLPLPTEPTPEIGYYWLSLLMAVLLFAVGAWIEVSGARDKTARLGATVFVLSSLAMLSGPLREFPGWGPSSSAVALLLVTFWRPWHLPVGLHFIANFPHAAPQPRWVRTSLWVVYISAAVVWIALMGTAAAELAGVRPGPVLAALMDLRPFGRVGAFVVTGLESVAGTLIFVVLVRNYVSLPNATSRRRIRWAGLGLSITLADYLGVAAARFLFQLTGLSFWRQVEDFGNDLTVFAVAFAPIAMGYAVVKHRVLGIRVVVRRGIQYLLARQVLQAIVFLPIILIFAQAISHPNATLGDLVFRTSWLFYVAVAVTSAISLRYRRRMREWLDQKFFHTVLHQEELLSALIERVKTAESRDEVCITVAREIELALHVEALHILVRDSALGPLQLAYSRTPDRAKEARDYLNSIGRASTSLDSVLTLYETDDAKLALGPGPRPWRENLAVAIGGADGANIGVLVVGPKRSEEPYTRAERDLFRAIAGQMGVMFEVLALRMRVEDARRTQIRILARVDGTDVPLVRECPDCGLCFGPPEQICSHDGARLALTLPVERVIDEKYRLDRRIGRGAMGVVYEAFDERLSRAVAIKVMTSELFGNKAALARFSREARAAALLDHPNIVRVHDFGTLPVGAGYLVMELVRGVSWRSCLGQGPMAPELAAECIEQLCSAMETAHRTGVIHRDLKPENLMIADGAPPRVVVLDFGVAKMWADIKDKSMTLAGAPLGTHGYMSPEQRSGATVDQRTDIYSIAVICVEILSGLRPPAGGATQAWLLAALEERTEGRELIDALKGAIDHNPVRRPWSATRLGEQVAPLIRNTVLPLPGAPATPGAADTATIRVSASGPWSA